MEIDFRSIVLYLGKKGMSPSEIHRDIVETLGYDPISVSTVSKYLRLEKCSQSNQPIKKKEKFQSDQKNQIIVKHALKLYPFSSVRDIARMTNIPKSTVFRILTKQLQFVSKHLRWIPHFLNSSQKLKRVSQSRELLRVLEEARETDYKLFYTGDESWFYLDTDYDHQWLPREEKPPDRIKQKIDSKKYMVTIFWNPTGFLIVEALDDDMVFNSDYFRDEILEQIKDRTSDDREILGGNLILHFDNARPHISKKVMEYLDQNEIKRAPQPPYSPDIAPSDFFLFGYMKEKLKGCRFNSKEELLETIHLILNEISEEKLKEVFLEWESRLQQVIASNGNYI